jgi:hypothetical protein
LTPTEETPQKLTQADIQSAQQIISFCQLPIEYQQQAIIEHWDHIPPVSENYERARDTIIQCIDHLISQIK